MALLKRVASAVVLIPVFVWTVTSAPSLIFSLVVIGAGAAGAWELTRMFARVGRPTAPMLTVLAAAVVIASFHVPQAPLPALTLAVVVVLAAAVWRTGPPSVEATLVAILAVVYVGMLLGHAVLLRRLEDGAALVLFLVGVTWAGETVAYVVGHLLGRHRLAARVSPGKTLEGAAGQILASIGMAVAMDPFVAVLNGVHAAGAGALIGVVGQVGDLAESVIKRSLGAKDAGELIPGHGGLLDRLDGLLFNTPTLFYYVSLLGARP